MGKPTGFLEFERQDRGYENIETRRQSWNEFVEPLPEPALGEQEHDVWIVAYRSAITAARSTI